MQITEENYAPLRVSTVYDLSGKNVSVRTVYNLTMAKFVHIQIRGVEKAIEIQADKAEESGMISGPDYSLLISLKGTPVGKFNGHIVDGWWIADE